MSRPFLVLADLFRQLLPPLPQVPDTMPIRVAGPQILRLITRQSRSTHWVYGKASALSFWYDFGHSRYSLQIYRHAAQDNCQ